MSTSKPSIGVTSHVHTIDDFYERDRPKGTTSDQTKPLISKRMHLLVLKEIKSAMCFDKESDPPQKEWLTSRLPFLVLQHHARQKLPSSIETQRITSAGLTTIMNSSVDCVSGLYTTLVTFFGMVASVDEYPVVGCAQKTNYDTIWREYAVRIVE